MDQLLAPLAAGVHQLLVTCDAHFHPLSAPRSKHTNTKVQNTQIGEEKLIREIQEYKGSWSM